MRYGDRGVGRIGRGEYWCGDGVTLFLGSLVFKSTIFNGLSILELPGGE